MTIDLLGRTAELISIPSLSREETLLADHVQADLSRHEWLEVRRIGDSVIARSERGLPSRVLLAGHLDTVPPAGNEKPDLRGGSCSGIGAVDMKGGLAVMLGLAGEGPVAEVDLTFVFYACEEVDRSENALRALGRERPDLLGCDIAILGEPTGGYVEAGCQGSARVEVTLGGVRAHTARPWMGRNAIHRLGGVLSSVEGFPGREPVIDGCEFRESLQAVAVEGGVAGNVVPDRAVLRLNQRVAPDRSVEGGIDELRRFLEPHMDEAAGDSFVVLDAVDGARPNLEHPLLARLVHATGRPPRAKLGLTDVSLFSELGIPATNFGPGDPTLAHSPHESVSGEELDHAYRALSSALGMPA